jgi:hypothetical protein
MWVSYLSLAMFAVELLILIRIWLDGRAILQVEQANYELYSTHINEIRAERLRRMGQLAAARQSKANKAAAKKTTSGINQ